MKKFVINLKRRTDRLESFERLCPFNGVEVIYGYDAKNEEPSISEKLVLNKFKKIRPGEIGCFISHIRIYHEMINRDIPYAFIMEDDAIFCNDFINKFNSVQEELPKDTDLLYIGGRFVPNFITRNCSRISNNIVKHNNTHNWNRPDMDRTTHAYIISKAMAQIFINEFYGSSNIMVPIDSWIIDVSLKHSIPIYNSQPLLCFSPLVGDSDIR